MSDPRPKYKLEPHQQELYDKFKAWQARSPGAASPPVVETVGWGRAWRVALYKNMRETYGVEPKGGDDE